MPRLFERFVTGHTTRDLQRRAGVARHVRRGSVDEHAALENLEPRTLFSFSWTAGEVYLAELVNRARANPQAEAARLGINLAAGLTSAESARLVPQEPLALNRFLTAAARAHSLDMATRNFFDHTNPDGLSPTQRAQAAGYGGTAGENIAGGYTTVDQVHEAWLQSVGHRKNVLSLHSNFDASFHYDEFGPGFALNAGGAYTNYYTELFGYQGSTPALYLLGVVFNDADNNNFYGIGEGASGVRIDVALQSAPGNIITTFTTDAAGNYQLPLAAGAYSITFTRVSDGYSIAKTATLSNVNVKLDARTVELLAPESSDDYANAGNWAGAGVITLDPTLGNGAAAGLFEATGDTDLFRFTATRSGVTTVTLTHPAGLFGVQLVAYNGSQAQLIVGTPGGEFGNGSVASFQVVAGQTYFLLARPTVNTSTGAYVLLIQGPPPAPGGSDDYANIGDLAGASILSLDSVNGNGSKVGYLEIAGDTDLFKIVATRTGVTTVTLASPEGVFGTQLRLFNSAGAQIALGIPGGEFGNGSVITFDIVEGTTYYLGAEAIDGVSRGIYTVQVVGPGPVPTPPPPVVITSGHQPNYHSLITTVYLKGKLTFVFNNQWGQPLVATKNPDGSWAWKDIRGGPADPVVDGEMVSWVDAREHITYIAMRGLDGVILFREDQPGVWSHRNLTAEIDGAMIFWNDLEVIIDPMNRAMLAGMSDSGDLILYQQLLVRKPNGEYRWSFRNVTALDVEAKDLTMPYATSEIVSWVTPAKSQNIAFVDEEGSIQLFYKPKGKARWNLQNLGAIAPTAPLMGEISVAQAANRAIVITGTDENENVWVTTFRPGNGWSSRNITARLNGTTLQMNSVTTYVSKAGQVHIVGIRPDGKVTMYRFMHVRNAFAKVNIAMTPPELRRMVGRLNTTVDRDTGETNIVGTLNTQALVRWNWKPGQGWIFENISFGLASTPPG